MYISQTSSQAYGTWFTQTLLAQKPWYLVCFLLPLKKNLTQFEGWLSNVSISPWPVTIIQLFLPSILPVSLFGFFFLLLFLHIGRCHAWKVLRFGLDKGVPPEPWNPYPFLKVILVEKDHFKAHFSQIFGCPHGEHPQILKKRINV